MEPCCSSPTMWCVSCFRGCWSLPEVDFRVPGTAPSLCRISKLVPCGCLPWQAQAPSGRRWCLWYLPPSKAGEAMRTGGALRQHCCVHAKASSSSGLTAQSLAQEQGCVLGSLPFSIGTVPLRPPTQPHWATCALYAERLESCVDRADCENPLLLCGEHVDACGYPGALDTHIGVYTRGDPPACVCTASPALGVVLGGRGTAALQETLSMG